jgi:hypothetical protein
MKRIDWRALLARLPLPMLALAASYGVYSFALLFVPQWVAGIQAAAFELTYVGLAVTQGLNAAQRKRATGISIGAVAASIIYNTLAGWFHAQPQLLNSAGAEAWLCLAVLHGAPLAWVAYLVADLLLHSEGAAVATEATAETAQEDESVAQTVNETPIDPWVVAQELRSAGVPLRKIAMLVKVSEGTVRNHTIAVSRNGHGAPE